MENLSTLIQQGGAGAWWFIPSAIMLGALHGLEPGHSKTMMAAFIVAIRGSVKQAILLGLAATLSHTAVVWAVAISGMYFWQGLDAEASEPYFQVASAVLIVGIAAWMFARTWRDHHHANHHHGHTHPHVHEEDHHDAHELAHANDIRRRFANNTNVTTGQIVLFGLTGGLIPCPAAITVLLLCLQLKEITLGATLVLGFSIGLAITLVTVGAIAAYSIHHASKHFTGFGKFARIAPYFSSGLIMLIGLYVGYHGWAQLAAQ